ncbi:MAG: hypothetical protein NTY53_05055 [Kiritimatiellaeota bacterium]|nr:hypothetical protein [Kiritimatiellota bacterium]
MPKSTTPKAILEALFPDAVTIAGLKLQPISAVHYLALERLENPLIVSGLEAGTDDLIEALLILSLTPEQARALLAEGLDAVEARVMDLAGRIAAADLPGMTQALLAHISAAFNTAVPAKSESGEVRPLAPASSLSPSTPG